MKVLWINNVAIPRIGKMQGIENNTVYGGWLTGLSDKLLENKEINLCICYPDYNTKDLMKGTSENFSFFGIPMKEKDYCLYFGNILELYKPDVIHFFGTEFSWSYELCKMCQEKNLLDKTVISIQGLVSEYEKYFFEGLNFLDRYYFTLSELKSNISMKKIWYDYKKRGISEVKELQMVKNVIGRTTWDKACVKFINPNIRYFLCNETLRKEFYTDQWTKEKCKKYTIYVSQAGKPLKGFHKLVEALKIVVKYYPNVKVNVAGTNVLDSSFLRGSGYGLYLKKKIKKNNLNNNINFLGNLKAEEVKNYLLSSNVFVSVSAIENSPNSLGEAMLLGVPCISSDVGGVTDMMNHKIDGFIYPFSDSNLLAFYIMKIFEDDELANRISINARMHAQKTHNEKVNNDTLLNIYKTIATEN